MDHDQQPTENNDDEYQTETFVFTGNGGPAFLTTVQNLMNRMIRGQSPQDRQQEQQGQQGQQGQQAEPQQREQPPSEDTDMPPADAPSLLNVPVDNRDEEMPSQEQLPHDGEPPSSRPIRPLPRPHTHVHAHTAGGVIDLFTFNIAGLPQPSQPGTATFTLTFGPDFFAGFEGLFQAGMQKDREPDPERGKVLLKGMEVVPEGLVRRLERTGGVSGGNDNENTAGCAVCWGPLLDEIEPGEWDTAKQKEEKAKMAADGKVQAADEGLHGRIVVLPCAHVYHAECLQPWFSRNTTCPMCRFDVDPESLTWSPHPPVAERPPPANDTAANAAAEARTAPQDPSGPQAEQPQLVNAAEADRLHIFMNSIFQAVPLAHPQPESPMFPSQSQSQPQPQPQPQPQSQPDQTPPQPQQPQSQTQPQSQIPSQSPHPSQNQAAEQTETPVFGPAPPAPPPPNAFVLPPLFRMPMPLFIVPQPTPSTPSGTHVPPTVPGPDHPQPAAFNGPQATLRPTFFNPILQPQPHVVPPFHVPYAPQPPHGERKAWIPPEPVGKTLRQRVEEKERELGLRCDDMICGIAPSDEDPNPDALQSEAWTKRINIKAAYDGHGKACEHSFHPICLVTSARVAGVTGDESGEAAQDDEVQVACPACRAVGSLDRADWDLGVQASLAELSS